MTIWHVASWFVSNEIMKCRLLKWWLDQPMSPSGTREGRPEVFHRRTKVWLAKGWWGGPREHMQRLRGIQPVTPSPVTPWRFYIEPVMAIVSDKVIYIYWVTPPILLTNLHIWFNNNICRLALPVSKEPGWLVVAALARTSQTGGRGVRPGWKEYWWFGNISCSYRVGLSLPLAVRRFMTPYRLS